MLFSGEVRNHRSHMILECDMYSQVPGDLTYIPCRWAEALLSQLIAAFHSSVSKLVESSSKEKGSRNMRKDNQCELSSCIFYYCYRMFLRGKKNNGIKEKILKSTSCVLLCQCISTESVTPQYFPEEQTERIRSLSEW